MKRILIVEVNWIGDVLFSTPFIRTVREVYPDSYIACLLHPRCRDMLKTNPRVNEIIIYDEEAKHKGLIGKLRLIDELKRHDFDTAFMLHRSFTKALLAYLAGIKERIGYATKNRRWILAQAIDEPREPIHKVDYFLRLAEACGMRVGSRSYEFFISDDDRRSVERLLSESGVRGGEVIAVLNPGGNWMPKRWPKDKFAELADKIAQRPNLRVVITGADKDIALAEEIAHLTKIKPVIVAGRTTLGQLAAVMERSKVVIANDSGPMHLASAVGACVTALFGPTSPEITGPRGTGVYTVISRNGSCVVPCYDKDCSVNYCMSAISVDDVLKEIDKVLR